MDLQTLFASKLHGPMADWLGLGAEAEVSYLMDLYPLQDAFRFRARHLGLRVASLLIDEKGELDGAKADGLRGFFTEGRFVLGPGREGDALIYGHIGACLEQLELAWSWIRRFSMPLCHKKAEEIVRQTLWPESVRGVETVHVRRAVMAAWLTLLRQTTGSCFATAPAILVQQGFPGRFFKDLYDLLNLGQMKRTVAGKEYAVPLSLQGSGADLHRGFAAGMERAPGVKIACEACGIPWSEGVRKKIGELQSRSAEHLFRVLLLSEMGLTEEDLREEENLARIQMTSFMARQGAVYYQRPSERGQKVAEWKKRVATACLAFQGLTECALLRAWEYTIASFCDVKTDFARWNLFVGLGMHPEQKEGVGAFLYSAIDEQLQQCNREIEALQRLHEQQMGTARALEVMYGNALDDARRNQIKAEFTMQMAEASATLGKRDLMADRADALSRFFSSVLEQYFEKLQEHFQELFDPAIRGEGEHLHDDSPAGFRLVYKHGRKDASQWTSIATGEQYVEALREFFAAVEGELAIPPEIDKKWVTEVTTQLIQFIQSPHFLAAAEQRAKEQGRRSPWDYVSGGTMETLLQSYCNREHPFTEAKVVPRSAEELLQFLAQEEGQGPRLMHSPTHAFICYGGHLPHNAFALLEQNRKFLAACAWSEPMQEHIAHRIEERLPEVDRALFLHLFNRKHKSEKKGAIRDHLIEAAGQKAVALVDAVLWESTPLISAQAAQDAVNHVLQGLGQSGRASELVGAYFGPVDVHRIVKEAILTAMPTPFVSVDWDMKIAETMRHFGYSYPYPLLFADTNWSGWFLGFVLNPATERLELWRLNRVATQGYPMLDWKEWLSAQNSAPWVVLSRPSEYTDAFEVL